MWKNKNLSKFTPAVNVIYAKNDSRAYLQNKTKLVTYSFDVDCVTMRDDSCTEQTADAEVGFDGKA